ncbi:amidohydrolase family protein [uncultured Anaerococcus sp.]|uniref:amidohydrolase family protein n=1 Tax=uncultured Anaerococcus sp. TaxID=293428 RepID=UPI00262F3902|nr:TatD family hydrolase [uncultured Anaerococcus sp.]
MIIDGHMHLPVYYNLKTFDEKKNILLAELNKNKVSKAVIISDSIEESTIGNVDQCISLFSDNKDIYIVAGLSPKDKFKEQRLKLEKYFFEKKIIGIKLFPDHENFKVNDPILFEFYAWAQENNCPVLFHSEGDFSKYSNPSLVEEVLLKFTELKLVCCHCFYPNVENCFELLYYPNLYFELSSVADRYDILEEVSDEIKSLSRLIEQRIIFGSDYGGCSQKDHINFVNNLDIDKEIKDKIFSENIINLYELN